MPTFEVIDTPEVAKLVQFSTGKLNPEAKDSIDFKCHHMKERIKSNKRRSVVATKVKDVKYSGQNFGMSDHFSTDACDYYVAVHLKGADKVQVLPAELFRLMPQLEEVVKDDDEELSHDKAKLSKMDKRTDLIKQFGSGQMQRRVNVRQTQRLDETMVEATSEVVAKRYAATPKRPRPETVSAIALKLTPGVEGCAVPPHNKDATEPEDVYLLETIIYPELMDALYEQSENFSSCTIEDIQHWRETKEYYGVVIDLLEKLPSEGEERWTGCNIIMYMNCLIQFYNKKSFEIRKNDRYPAEWKGLVKKALDDTFTIMSKESDGKKGRTRPPRLRDLCLSHLLVLYMRMSNYTISLRQLMADLKLPMKRLTLHCQMLGMKIKPGKKGETPDTTSATLKLPLTFPIKGKGGGVR